MIKAELNNQWNPVPYYQNYYVEMDEDGNQTMQFEIPLDDMYYHLCLETVIEDEYGRWVIKKVKQLTQTAVITCEPDMDDWYAIYHLKPTENEHLQTKTIGDALNYIKPKGWMIVNADVCKLKRTLDLEKCTSYDLLMRAKTLYDVQYDIDTLHRTVTIVDPNEKTDLGVYVTPELNQKSISYKGDSSSFVTRLYCYGADDLTFADINNGKPYVENTAYNGKVICSSWTDQRYTNMESLLEDGKKKLAEMSLPTGSYTIDVVDLQEVDSRYKNLEMRLRSSVHCIINPEMNIDVIHRIVKKRIYPDNPSANKITLSNQPRTLEKMWNALKENVQTVQKDGMRFETEVKQTNKEITELAKKTDENTKGIQSVEQKITPEQLLIKVSDSIKSGNKLDVTQVIIDLLGLTIKNGGIRVYDGDDNLVLYVDDKTKKLVFKGDIQTDEDLIVGDNIYIGKNEGLQKCIHLGDASKIRRWKMQSGDYVVMQSDFNTGLQCLTSDDNVSSSIYAMRDAIQMSHQPHISSDKRLKENIKSVDLLNIFNHFDIKEFNYRGNKNKTVGVIAQDFVGTSYEDIILSIDGNGFYSVDYNVILMALVQKVQYLEKLLKEGEQNGYHSNTD